MTPQNQSYQGNKALLYFRSAILLFAMTSATIIFAPLVILATIFPFSVRYKLACIWVNWILWVANVVCGLTFQVSGLENLPLQDNAIILSKHQSAWETIAFTKIFPRQVFLLKQSLLWIPFWGWAMAALKPIAIDRTRPKAALRALVEKGSARLKEGFWVVIFPEGTRTAPGAKTKFNAGGSLLAQRSEFPVIPVAHNAGEFWPRYSFLKYPGTIKVKIGPPIISKGRKAKEINQEAELWISDAMQKL